jgi:hypothetical protein
MDKASARPPQKKQQNEKFFIKEKSQGENELFFA